MRDEWFSMFLGPWDFKRLCSVDPICLGLCCKLLPVTTLQVLLFPVYL